MQSLFDIMGAGENPAPFCVIRVGGAPRGKGRPRFRIIFPRRGKPFAHVYTDAETLKYESYIADIARIQMGNKTASDRPIAVRFFTMMPVPESWPRKKREAALSGLLLPIVKPDLDNIEKATYDAVNKIIYLDDKQIVRKFVSKEYAEHPGLIVEFYEL